MTQIIIIGYGKMGQAVEQACLARGLGAPQIVRTSDDLATTELADNAVAIEFTRAPACLENFKILLARGVPIVTGTTGWLAHEDEIKSLVREHAGAFLYAANFSIGVHVFWRLVGQASKMFNTLTDYDVYGHEVHHRHKVDSPSGTAHHTAQIILDNMDRKTAVVSGDVSGPLAEHKLHFSASRGGHQTGEHSVYFDSPDDTLTLRLHSKGRSGYANGAIDCALWLKGKKGYFGIDDYLKDRLP